LYLAMVRFYRLSDNVDVSLDYVASLGVLYWSIDPVNYDQEGKLAKIRKERGYTYHDVVTVSPKTLPNYEDKIKHFFEEHLHKDEEIRFFLEGSGFFDVRGHTDEWIRIHASGGDMITLPRGIYHRYSNDDKNYAKVMRLFQGDPIWTPFNRAKETDTYTEREKYVSIYLNEVSPHMKRVQVESPTDFTDIVGRLSGNKVFLLFRSSTNKDTGAPSEIACQRAVPIVKSVLGAVLSEPFTLVDCEVEPTFKQNPDHFYRLHEKVKLPELPCLVFWGSGKSIQGSQLHDEETVTAFVKSVDK